MPRKFTGEIFHSPKRITQKNGDIYVYDRTMRYNPHTQKSEVIESRLSGKIKAGTSEIVPTRPKKSAKTATPSTRQHVGAMDILDFVGTDSLIDDNLLACFDEGDAQKIISIARYLVATEGQSLTRLENWALNHPLPYTNGITEDIYYKLFSSLGINEKAQQQYFQLRSQQLNRSSLIAYDSTTVSTYSANQIEARQGFNKDRDGLDTIKVLTLYSVMDREPIAFTKQPGNLPDVTSLANALKQLQTLSNEKSLIVTDNGYYSQSNMAEMAKAGMHFLTAAPHSLRWIKDLIDENRARIDDIDNMCPFDRGISGICIPVMRDLSIIRKRSRNGVQAGDKETFKRRLYVHIYFNRSNEGRDELALREKLATLKEQLENGVSVFDEASEEKIKTFLNVSRKGRGGKIHVSFNNDAYKEAGRYYGYFALISNKENNPFEALKKYRLREKIEEMFSILKSGLDARRPRTWFPDNLRGRMFVQFVALGYYCALQKRIDNVLEELGKPAPSKAKKDIDLEESLKRWLEKKSIVQILDWFDCVEQITVDTLRGKKRWSTETTNCDRLFLEKLGMKLKS